MEKYKIIDGEEVSITDVFKSEPKFTDEFLIKKEEFAKVLKAIGITDPIESIEKQYPTSDGRALDLLVVLESGLRVGLEAQIETSDMVHISKLPYYLDNIRNKDDGESIIGILMAEQFTQEAIDYYTTLNELDHFDLYLVKSLLIKVGDNVVFTPQMNYPTPTTNNFKKFKQGRAVSEAGEPHDENKQMICKYLDDLKISYKVDGPVPINAAYKIKFKYNGYRVTVMVLKTGKFNIFADGNHANEEIFKNNKNYFKLANDPLCRNFEEFKKAYETFIANL